MPNGIRLKGIIESVEMEHDFRNLRIIHAQVQPAQPMNQVDEHVDEHKKELKDLKKTKKRLGLSFYIKDES